MGGKVYAVGLGSMDAESITGRARRALEESDLICGYTPYVLQTRRLFPDKEVYETGMTREIERCRYALETARSGRTVSVVCSGDAGVYAMAGPLLQLCPEYPGVEVEVIPGVSAAQSGAALLGAPLGHDFCVISLSDLLTPWEVIEKRLRCAAEGDFSVCLYNPASKKRAHHLQRACDILLDAGKSEGTVCGIVRSIGGREESVRILSLGSLRDTAVDMSTTVFIGSSATQIVGGRMVTPRGYEGKRALCGS